MTLEAVVALALSLQPPLVIRAFNAGLDGVVYTACRDLEGAEWQTVRIAFDEIRPNPYFQPPGAKTGAPIDVSDVKFVAFAPQDQTPGRLSIGTFVVSK